MSENDISPPISKKTLYLLISKNKLDTSRYCPVFAVYDLPRLSFRICSELRRLIYMRWCVLKQIYGILTGRWFHNSNDLLLWLLFESSFFYAADGNSGVTIKIAQTNSFLESCRVRYQRQLDENESKVMIKGLIFFKYTNILCTYLTAFLWIVFIYKIKKDKCDTLFSNIIMIQSERGNLIYSQGLVY